MFIIWHLSQFKGVKMKTETANNALPEYGTKYTCACGYTYDIEQLDAMYNDETKGTELYCPNCNAEFETMEKMELCEECGQYVPEKDIKEDQICKDCWEKGE